VVGEPHPKRNFITNILSMAVVTVYAQTDGQKWQNRQFIFLIFIVNPPSMFNTFLVEA
jgi:signal peptidase I